VPIDVIVEVNEFIFQHNNGGVHRSVLGLRGNSTQFGERSDHTEKRAVAFGALAATAQMRNVRACMGHCKGGCSQKSIHQAWCSPLRFIDACLATGGVGLRSFDTVQSARRIFIIL